MLVGGCTLHSKSSSVQASPSSASGQFFNSKDIFPEGNAVLHYLDARLYKLHEQDAQALEALKLAVQKDQSSPYLHAELARHLAEANQFEQANLESDKALELEPENSQNRLLKGKLFSVRQQELSAREQYEKCIALNPEEFECYSMMARSYLLDKDNAKARATLAAFLKQDPRHPEALFFLATLYLEDGNQKKGMAVGFFIQPLGQHICLR